MLRPASLIVLPAALALAACAVGPDYKTPDTAPAALRNADAPAFVDATPEATWWQQFDDPVLDQLIAQTLSANPDLQIAGAHVRAARAVFSGAEFDLGPHIPLSAGYTHSKEQQPGFGTQRYDSESYSLGFDATWEIDIFGRQRRATEAARDELEAQQATLRDVQVSVAAETARNYFELRGAQERYAVAQRNLANQTEALRLTQARRDIGRGDELDVQNAQARLAATQATLPLLDARQKAAGYRLAVLAGKRPGELDALLAEPATPLAYAQQLPIGDPSALLRQRPDVRVAERQLAAATARVGVATADLFPRVSVSGFVGFLSGDLGQLFRAGGGNDARAWSVAPTVSWAALDYGSVQARLRAAHADADAALASYQKTVLTALEDTENAFVGYRDQQQRLKSLQAQAEASRRAAQLAEIRYREGSSDFLTLLDAQRTQLAAEDALADTQTQVNVAVVAIYKALGGVGQPAETRLASN